MATTRSHDPQLEAERLKVAHTISTEWLIGYENYSFDENEVNYLYLFKCRLCHDMIVNGHAGMILYLAFSHMNKCWDNKTKDLFIAKAKEIVSLECVEILEVTQRGEVEYLCNKVLDTGQPCEEKDPHVDQAVLHYLTHYWPNNRDKRSTRLKAMCEVASITLWDHMNADIQCVTCHSHFGRQQGYLEHMPCIYDDLALAPGHNEKSEGLVFECPDCHDIWDTREDLDEHRKTCEKTTCLTCLKIMPQKDKYQHTCNMFECLYCHRTMTGLETYRHRCAEAGDKFSSYQRVDLVNLEVSGQNKDQSQSKVQFEEQAEDTDSTTSPPVFKHDTRPPGTDTSTPRSRLHLPGTTGNAGRVPGLPRRQIFPSQNRGNMQVGGGAPPPPGPNREYRCRHCHVKFMTLQDLAKHEPNCVFAPENQRRPLRCPICHFVVTGSEELTNHIQDVHGYQEMICPVCHRNVFRDTEDFLNHISGHSDTLSGAFQQLTAAQSPAWSLYSNNTAQQGSTVVNNYNCKLCFAQFSRDDTFFEHYSMHRCSSLTGMTGDINSRSSPLCPPRRYNPDSPHDRKKLNALTCIKDVPLMNKCLLVDVLAAIVFQQTVEMPIFGSSSGKTVKETEVNTIKELKLNSQDPLETALVMEDFLKKLTAFISTVGLSESAALNILKRKVGQNLWYTLEQFCQKWTAVAIGEIPFFIPCAFLELTYMCAASPRLAKMQLAQMTMMSGEGPTELLNRIMRLSALATKDLPDDLKCHQAEELSFNAFLKALPVKCKRILMTEQTLREKLNQEPIGALGALQLIQKKISNDTILTSDKTFNFFMPSKPAGKQKNSNPPRTPEKEPDAGPAKQKGKNPRQFGYAAGPAPENPANQQDKPQGKPENRPSIRELIKRANVKFGACLKCGGTNHRFTECTTFPEKILPPKACKFHGGKYLHWGKSCPLNPQADADAKKRKCYLTYEYSETGSEPTQQTEEGTEISPPELAGMAHSQTSQKSVGSLYQQWVETQDDDEAF